MPNWLQEIMPCIAAVHKTGSRGCAQRLLVMISLFYCLPAKVKISPFPVRLHPPPFLGEGRLQADRIGGERKMVETSTLQGRCGKSGYA